MNWEVIITLVGLGFALLVVRGIESGRLVLKGIPMCFDCGYKWSTHFEREPKQCPKCRSRNVGRS